MPKIYQITCKEDHCAPATRKDGTPIRIHSVRVFNPPAQPTEFEISNLSEEESTASRYWITSADFIEAKEEAE